MPHTAFISYSREDETTARAINDALTKRGVTCWIDRQGIRFGESYTEVINQAIRESAMVIWLCSRHSVASRFVQYEISTAQAHKRPVGLVLLESLDVMSLPPPFNITVADKQGIAFFEGSFDENCTKLADGVKRIAGSRGIGKMTRKVVVALGAVLLVGASIWAGVTLKWPRHNVTEEAAAPSAALPAAAVPSQVPAAEVQQPQPPRLQLDILSKRERQNQFTVIKDGDDLASETDDYVIVMRPLTPGWLYIFQVDAEGKTDWLFPRNPGSDYSNGSNPVEASKIIQIPAEDSNEALYLDTTAGIEHVYAVLSADRWTALENALQAGQNPASLISGPGAVAKVLDAADGVQMRGIGGARTEGGTLDPAAALATAKVYEGQTFTLPMTNQIYEASSTCLVVDRWFHHVPSGQ